jgi:hypothetical protein
VQLAIEQGYLLIPRKPVKIKPIKSQQDTLGKERTQESKLDKIINPDTHETGKMVVPLTYELSSKENSIEARTEDRYITERSHPGGLLNNSTRLDIKNPIYGDITDEL